MEKWKSTRTRIPQEVTELILESVCRPDTFLSWPLAWLFARYDRYGGIRPTQLDSTGSVFQHKLSLRSRLHLQKKNQNQQTKKVPKKPPQSSDSACFCIKVCLRRPMKSRAGPKPPNSKRSSLHSKPPRFSIKCWNSMRSWVLKFQVTTIFCVSICYIFPASIQSYPHRSWFFVSSLFFPAKIYDFLRSWAMFVVWRLYASLL